MSTGGAILVVEDEPAIQELVAFACGNAGFAVRRAGDARSARAEVQRELPDLVVLDWMLPDRSGIDLLRELRGAERTRALPVIMLTARGCALDSTPVPTTTWSSPFRRASWSRACARCSAAVRRN
jgi:DNA-binding response OmpR family regulator